MGSAGIMLSLGDTSSMDFSCGESREAGGIFSVAPSGGSFTIRSPLPRGSRPGLYIFRASGAPLGWVRSPAASSFATGGADDDCETSGHGSTVCLVEL